MHILFILNGAPYGAEPTYNGLGLAGALARQERQSVRLFLMGDAAARGTLDELAQWTARADKVLVF
ncbi:MAG: hypothetical protein AB1768_01965 [Pseudomonadota bacterium]|jgi:sulfur relay (sulfurtransferase) complex TusBCD TusD component (DsrE family)